MEGDIQVQRAIGHPPVFHYVKEEAVIHRMEPENAAIGLFEHLSRTCSMLQVPFKPGDHLLLYTDGLTESSNPVRITTTKAFVGRLTASESALSRSPFDGGWTLTQQLSRGHG